MDKSTVVLMSIKWLNKIERPLVLLSKCLNHEEDFFKLCLLLRKFELFLGWFFISKLKCWTKWVGPNFPCKFSASKCFTFGNLVDKSIFKTMSKQSYFALCSQNFLIKKVWKPLFCQMMIHKTFLYHDVWNLKLIM